MKGALKLQNKCVFTKIDKEESLDNLENLRKSPNSDFEKYSDININLFV